ncbi:DNA cytosine methyltransferase [Runella sp.]|uniref:DNA cytosine methyltransferase n=1 Tax=Runella sp. TaxID=1960881 RepID=UPI0030165864
MTFIDLFAGAGGFSLGFEMAGGECLLMLERDEWAFTSYKSNRPNSETIMLNEDIKNLSLKHISEKINQNPDIIIGGPPCQGFSTAAGMRNFYDSRNELFLEFFNWVKHLSPKFFVIENVLGLTSKKNKDGDLYKELIIQKFKEIGYHIDFWTLNALEYGVPQQRIRVFFVGNNIGKQISKPEVTHSFDKEKSLISPITVSDALNDLPELFAGQGLEVQDYCVKPSNEYQKWIRKGAEKVLNHVAMKHTERLVNRYRLIQNGYKIEELPNEFKVRKRGEKNLLSDVKFGLNYRLLLPNRVSLTIPASFYSSFIHPFQPRNITAREAARLQSFPDNYFFYGKRTLMSNSYLKKNGIIPNLSQYNQIGNAVPPLLAKAIAQRIIENL